MTTPDAPDRASQAAGECTCHLVRGGRNPRCPRHTPASQAAEFSVSLEDMLIAYEHAAFDVADGRGDTARCSEYGQLRRDILARFAAAEKRAADAERERDEARAFGEEAARRHNKLLEDQRILRCAFCDAAYPPDTPPTQHDALTAHVRVCAAHPMRAVERALAAAEKEREAAVEAAYVGGWSDGRQPFVGKTCMRGALSAYYAYQCQQQRPTADGGVKGGDRG